MRLRKKIKYIYDYFSSASPKLNYIGSYHNHSNLGDEAIYIAHKNLFKEFCFIDVTKGSGSIVTWPLIKSVRSNLLAGGTTIGCKISNVNLVEKCFINNHNFVFGSGLNSESFWYDKIEKSIWDYCSEKWTKLLSKCFYVGVRGPLSKRTLKGWGIENIEIIGDPVLSLAKDSCRDINKFNISKKLGINLAHINHIWGDLENLAYKMEKVIIELINNGWNIYWFVLNFEDLKLCQTIASKTNTQKYFYKIYENPSDFFDLIKDVKIFVGMRLHSVILAHCAYIPSIMLEYRPKCRDYMLSIEQKDNCIKTDFLKQNIILEKIDNLANKNKEIRNALYNVVHKFKESQKIKAKEIATYLIN